MTYKTSNVCCNEIRLAVADGHITEIEFESGCSGNLQGIARLAIGRTPSEVISSLAGITCGRRGTSCPDQLAIALGKLA